MKRSLAAVALSMTGWVLTFGGAGCGESVTAAQACTEYATAVCARFDACSDGTFITHAYGDLATCETRNLANCEARLEAPDTGSSPGTILACAAVVPTGSCPDFFGGKLGCAVTAGERGDGASCAFGSQCKSAFCARAKDAACGVCAPVPAVGGACAVDSQCAPAQTCDKATSACVVPVAAGESCGSGAVCEYGLWCVGPGTALQGVCRAAVTQIGAACDPNRETAAGCDVNRGLLCDATSRTCAAVRYAGDGESCGVVLGMRVDCARSGTCVGEQDGTPGTCRIGADDGAPCDEVSGPRCLPLARCIPNATGTGGVCRAHSAAACH